MRLVACLKRIPNSIVPHCAEQADFARQYLAENQPDTETLNLKESWDGLHYLLSRDRRRPAKLMDTTIIKNSNDLMGIALIGKEILSRGLKYGFGSPKIIDADQVGDIHDLLKAIDWAVLQEDIIAEKMQSCGVYPEELWEDESKAAKYLHYWFLQLRKFYEKASTTNQAVVCYLKMMEE